MGLRLGWPVPAPENAVGKFLDDPAREGNDVAIGVLFAVERGGLATDRRPAGRPSLQTFWCSRMNFRNSENSARRSASVTSGRPM